MRVLLTWELGLNLGHLARLLPIAQDLKRKGHAVLIAARDIQSAGIVLRSFGIPFVQAPHLPNGIALSHRPTGFADILLSQGWIEQAALWALTHAWLNIFRLFRPDKMILDYSPTVWLAARIADIPIVLIGNGFELPPLTNPLPAFPNFSWATPFKAAQSDDLAVASANQILKAFKKPTIGGLRDLMAGQLRFFITLPELDHYGRREDAAYVGPLFAQLKVAKVNWPRGEGPRIFAHLRPETSQAKEILTALSVMKARIICVASGFDAARLAAFRGAQVRYSLEAVNLESLLDAHLCITYGAEGTMLRFLLGGVPQIISPWHVESYMSARKLEEGGLGRSLAAMPHKRDLIDVFEQTAMDVQLKKRTTAFSEKHARLPHEAAIAITSAIAETVERRRGLACNDQQTAPVRA